MLTLKLRRRSATPLNVALSPLGKRSTSSSRASTTRIGPEVSTRTRSDAPCLRPCRRSARHFSAGTSALSSASAAKPAPAASNTSRTATSSFMRSRVAYQRLGDDARAGLAAQRARNVLRVGDQAEAAAAADEVDERRNLGNHAARVELRVGLVTARLVQRHAVYPALGRLVEIERHFLHAGG